MIKLKKILTENKKLRIFDLDDTLIKSHGDIYVVHDDGTRDKLSTEEFAEYIKKPGDLFDYDSFNSVIDLDKVEILDKYMELFKKTIEKVNDDRRLYILTGRNNPVPIRDFLLHMGFDLNKINIVTIAGQTPDSVPYQKKEWIKQKIQDGYDDIYYLDDSVKNINAVKELGYEYPEIKLKTQLAT